MLRRQLCHNALCHKGLAQADLIRQQRLAAVLKMLAYLIDGRPLIGKKLFLQIHPCLFCFSLLTHLGAPPLFSGKYRRAALRNPSQTAPIPCVAPPGLCGAISRALCCRRSEFAPRYAARTVLRSAPAGGQPLSVLRFFPARKSFRPFPQLGSLRLC